METLLSFAARPRACRTIRNHPPGGRVGGDTIIGAALFTHFDRRKSRLKSYF